MTVKEVIEYLGRSNEGGMFSLDTTNPEYIMAMLPSLRATAIQISYNGNKFTAATKVVLPDWVQSFTIPISSQINNGKEYIVVEAPSPMPISSTVGGLSYLGSEDVLSSFIGARSMSDVNDFKVRGYLDNGNRIVYLPKDNGIFWVWGNKMLSSVYFSGVLNNPFDAPDWDDQTSRFPIDEKGLNIMRDLYKNQIGLETSQVKDVVSDNASTPQLPNLKNATK